MKCTSHLEPILSSKQWRPTSRSMSLRLSEIPQHFLEDIGNTLWDILINPEDYQLLLESLKTHEPDSIVSRRMTPLKVANLLGYHFEASLLKNSFVMVCLSDVEAFVCSHNTVNLLLHTVNNNRLPYYSKICQDSTFWISLSSSLAPRHILTVPILWQMTVLQLPSSKNQGSPIWIYCCSFQTNTYAYQENNCRIFACSFSSMYLAFLQVVCYLSESQLYFCLIKVI